MMHCFASLFENQCKKSVISSFLADSSKGADSNIGADSMTGADSITGTDTRVDSAPVPDLLTSGIASESAPKILVSSQL